MRVAKKLWADRLIITCRWAAVGAVIAPALNVRGFSPLISTEDSLSHCFTPARWLSPRMLQRGMGQSYEIFPFSHLLLPYPRLCSYIHLFGTDRYKSSAKSCWKSPPLPNAPGPSGSQDEDLTCCPESCPRGRTQGQPAPSLCHRQTHWHSTGVLAACSTSCFANVELSQSHRYPREAWKQTFQACAAGLHQESPYRVQLCSPHTTSFNPSLGNFGEILSAPVSWSYHKSLFNY